MTSNYDAPKGSEVARIVVGSAIVVLCLGAAVACETDSPTSAQVTVESVSFAKGGPGGGGGGGGTTAPTVGSVAPTAAAQDTTIDVNIFGTGFASGASATWSLNGDTTKVHVKSTKFVSASQLVARIIVPIDAPVALYDVQVMLIGGKKGVGAEMFQVLLGDPKATFYFPPPSSPLSVRGDGYVTQGSDAYANGVCGVNSNIFATASASNSGDATMQTNNSRFSDRKCAGYPRTLTVAYADGVVERGPTFINVRRIANTEFSIPVGSTAKRSFAINLGARCEKLLFSREQQGAPIPGDSVNVTRVSPNTWRVQTQPSPYDRAYCTRTGESFRLTVDFTIVASRDLP